MTLKVKYTSEDHLITRQAYGENAFMKEFEAGEYTIENPLVVKNPYLINPLCALVLFKTEKRLAPTLTVCGKEVSRENLTHAFTENTVHLLPVLGLYEDFANQVGLFSVWQ